VEKLKKKNVKTPNLVFCCHWKTITQNTSNERKQRGKKNDETKRDLGTQKHNREKE